MEITAGALGIFLSNATVVIGLWIRMETRTTRIETKLDTLLTNGIMKRLGKIETSVAEQKAICVVARESGVHDIVEK